MNKHSSQLKCLLKENIDTWLEENIDTHMQKDTHCGWARGRKIERKTAKGSVQKDKCVNIQKHP